MTGKYRTVVIDFPWPIKAKPPQKNRSRYPKDRAFSSRLNYLVNDRPMDYEFMSIEDIHNFPIDNFAAENCQLFLWVINSKVDGVSGIEHGFQILRGWGFKYHHFITWHKNNDIPLYSPIRSKTEHVIYAFRGKLCREKMGVMANVFRAPITRHSEKPRYFYQLIRRWTPEPRIDIFARKPHPGFDGWGDEYAGKPKQAGVVFG